MKSSGDTHLIRIIRTWWPLAASWLLMGLEGPALSAVMARLANPELNLAAYGGIVNPISLVVESPIIMLLAASVALSKDWASYLRVRRFMMVSSAILTGLHILIAFTPLYDLISTRILGVPAAILEPGRLGLQIMVPWTWSIAYRRFNQGVMIRFGHSRAVGAGTMVRLSTDALVLAVGYLLGGQGIVVATLAQTAGVFSEAAFAGWRVRPILRDDLHAAPPVDLIAWREFFAFYTPLALTQLLTLVWQPIGSAVISRLPQPVESLAVFPVLLGVIFLLRSTGMAFNEVVVAKLDEPGSSRALRRFSTLLAAGLTLLALALAATPLSTIWFSRISALTPHLAELAKTGFWITLPIPALTVMQSWFQGAILYSRNTRGIPESILAFLITLVVVLGIGMTWGNQVGLYTGMTAFTLANTAQTAWLWLRSRPIRHVVVARDMQSYSQ